jgi:hypothetical protein
VAIRQFFDDLGHQKSALSPLGLPYRLGGCLIASAQPYRLRVALSGAPGWVASPPGWDLRGGSQARGKSGRLARDFSQSLGGGRPQECHPILLKKCPSNKATPVATRLGGGDKATPVAIRLGGGDKATPVAIGQILGDPGHQKIALSPPGLPTQSLIDPPDKAACPPGWKIAHPGYCPGARWI